MNPFDDTFPPAGKTTSTLNPFDSDDGLNPFSDGADSFNDLAETETTTIGLEEDTSAEASWQYLGDLPYRRVPIYSNVRWESKLSSKNKNDQSPSTVHFGLASFPAAALHHHGSSGTGSTAHQFSNPRVLLSKTTVTKCVGCPNGGPVAVITLPLMTGSVGFARTELRILTVSGQPLARLEFPPPYLNRKYAPIDVLAIGFTSRCTLIAVLKDSLCLTFDLRGEPVLPPFHIIENGTDVQLAHVYEGGVAVLANNKDCAIVELFDNHDDAEYLKTVHSSAQRILPVSSGNLSSGHASQDAMPPHYAVVTYLPTSTYAALNLCHYCAIAVLPRSRTLNRHPEVFLSTSDNSVIIVDTATTRATDVNCRARISSPIVDMSFAPNGRFLACFTEASLLTVISTSFETKVLDFDTSEGSSSPPLEMKWCGEDSVVLHWKNLGVLMVGPYGDWLRFPYDGMDNVFLLPEIDCCRVITDSSVEILQRVPPATTLLLRIGSIETTAMLLDASDAYHSGSNVTDEAVRSISRTGQLEEAIETCIDSATKEFDITTQKRLLRAASYGMHFSYKLGDGEQNVLIGGPITGSDAETRILPSRTTVKFVDAARKLRILNAMRNPEVGFLLTAAQYDAVSPTGVVARLIAMKRPSLANEIGMYLGLSKSVQLFARASKAAAFVEGSSHLSDAETAERAIRIINGDETDGAASPTLNRGGYASVAMAANKAGRPGVANLLLMLESSVAEKVPALISTGAYADALAVATAAR
jgi:vacuolar protein sorting-associated protein 16